jgi:uncharacterized membrane protein YfhO
MTKNIKGYNYLNSAAFDKYFEYYNADSSPHDNAEVTAYINKYWLPVAFMLSPDINDADISSGNPFVVQNNIMKKATGIRSDIFTSLYPKYENGNNDNVNVTPSNYGVYNYSVINTGSKGKVNQRYTVNETQQVYIYLKNPWHGGNKKAIVRLYYPNGDAYPENIESEVDNGATIDCGVIQAGGEIEISFEVHSGSATFYLYAASFDEGSFRYAYDILSDHVMQVSEFSDTSIKGTITADTDGLFFASVPYDKGWRIKVNGVERVVNPPSEMELRNANLDNEAGEKPEKEDPKIVKTFRDGFITIPLEAGTHEIELYYITDGLIPGVIISLICIGLIIIWEFISRNYKKQRKKTDEIENDIENFEKEYNNIKNGGSI